MNKTSISIILILLITSALGIFGTLYYKNQLEDMSFKMTSLKQTISDLNSEKKELSREYKKNQPVAYGMDLISEKAKDCIKREHYTTEGMNKCIYSSLDKWSKTVTNNYEKVKREMSPEQAELMEKSQQAWEAYKEAQWAVNEATIGTMEGSIYINILAEQKVSIVERRARELDGMTYYYQR